jgi:hypothetical protein
MNLPASIEGSGDRDPLPLALREKSRTVRQEGGPEGIEEFVNTLNKLADVCLSSFSGRCGIDAPPKASHLLFVQEARSSLDKAFQVLDQEEEEDKQVRAQHMSRWNRYALTVSLSS